MAINLARAAYESRHAAIFDLVAKAVSLRPASVGLVAFPVLILLCVGPLACYHCSLVCQNKTTSEEIKMPYGEENPFADDCVSNCNEACCATFESPRIFPRSLADEELGNAAMLPVGERETDASPRTNSPRTTDGDASQDGASQDESRGGSGPAEPASEHNTIPMSAAAERPGTPGSHKLNLCKPCSSGSSSSGKSDPSSRV
uniref:Protein S-acyltransferase n=1 Tax=Haptolina ericina TaxID=156174 RepID=A0A7S3B6H7_9EUKA